MSCTEKYKLLLREIGIICNRYSVGELHALLPGGTALQFSKMKTGEYRAEYKKRGVKVITFYSLNEADAAAKIYLYLYQNNLLTICS